MRTFAAALLTASAVATELPQGAAIYASTVCVANMAGFVLDWWMDDLISGQSSADSPSYPIDQTKCMSIGPNTAGIQVGDFLEVYIHAHVGATKTASSAIIYQPTPAITASFTCKGTTLNFNCNLNGQDYMEQLEAHGMYDELYAFAAWNGVEYTPKILN